MPEHFKVLREAGLVEVRQDAQRRWYRLRPYRRMWAHRLAALHGDFRCPWPAERTEALRPTTPPRSPERGRPVRALVIDHIGWSSSDIAPQRHQGSEA